MTRKVTSTGLLVVVLLLLVGAAGVEAQLDPYRIVTLDSGFSPDPYVIEVSAGGFEAAPQVSGCRGRISIDPDVRLHYDTAGGWPLHIWVESSIDTTLIVRGPDNIRCDDDSGGGLGAYVDYSTPASGIYDIWVGVYDSDDAFEDVDLVLSELDPPFVFDDADLFDTFDAQPQPRPRRDRPAPAAAYQPRLECSEDGCQADDWWIEYADDGWLDASGANLNVSVHCDGTVLDSWLAPGPTLFLYLNPVVTSQDETFGNPNVTLHFYGVRDNDPVVSLNVHADHEPRRLGVPMSPELINVMKRYAKVLVTYEVADSGSFALTDFADLISLMGFTWAWERLGCE